MGFRFFRSFNLGGVRLNVSSSGFSYSVGKRGVASVTKSSDGTHVNTNVPVEGASYRTRISGKHSKPIGGGLNKNSKAKRFLILMIVLSLLSALSVTGGALFLLFFGGLHWAIGD